MRILVDESLPLILARELPVPEVSTVRQERWLGLRNGVLLRAAVDRGFHVLVTADGALRHQQNLVAIGIGVVLVTGVRNRIQDLRPLIPQIVAALATVKAGQLIEIAASR